MEALPQLVPWASQQRKRERRGLQRKKQPKQPAVGLRRVRPMVFEEAAVIGGEFPKNAEEKRDRTF
jgi:hypothetical protein